MSTKSVKAPRERSVVFYKKRATELAQTVLKLQAQVTGLEQSNDLAWQRTTQAEKDLEVVGRNLRQDHHALVSSLLGIGSGLFLGIIFYAFYKAIT